MKIKAVYQTIGAYIALMRAYMSILVGVTAVCGMFLSSASVDNNKAILSFLAQCLITAGGFALNDILDRDRDSTVTYKPLVAGTISIANARLVTMITIGLGLIISFSLGILPFAIVCAQTIIVYAYSYIKLRSGITANLITAALCGSSFLYGAAVQAHLGQAWIPALLTVEFIAAREIVKDLLDEEPDRLANVPTIPVRYGYCWTRLSVLLLVTLTVVTSMFPGIRNTFGTGYVIMMGTVDLVLVLATLFLLRRLDRIGAGRFLLVTAIAFPAAISAFFL